MSWAPPGPGEQAAALPAGELEALRARLDDIDALLLDRVRDRIACCLEIADVKRRQGVAMMQRHRIAVVQERAARFASENGIDGDFLRRLYELIIDETCRVETLVIEGSAGVSQSGCRPEQMAGASPRGTSHEIAPHR